MLSKIKRTTTRSFRVDEAALRAIEKEAAARNISVNTLVNQLVLSFANFDRYFVPLSMIKIASDTFRYLLDAVPDEAVGEVGRRTGANVVKSVILSKHGTMNLDTVLDYFKMVSDHSKIYTYNETQAGGKRAVTLIHKLGKKGSLYYAQYVNSVFEMINIQPRVSSTENSVTIRF